ncbi:hypothetical protein MHY87_16890 [Microvirga sp. ACRRW]|uniref:hypothetical protein n=1 Tax=Microvirga sp. ACRRW TaxID=2918205 RepID=UPI001EF73538|nr:hypothetical protein [Microvirga sp. ACRRW]MCG7394583.1 hypothetical protein [Microvirga sp. ACRRW]
MKTTDTIAVTRKAALPKRPHNSRATEAKAVAVSEWAPQPSTMTRAEIRKLVIDQIG